MGALRCKLVLILFSVCASYSSSVWSQNDPRLAEDSPKDCHGLMSYAAIQEIVDRHSPSAMEQWPSVRNRYLSGLPENESLFVRVLVAAEGSAAHYLFVVVDSIEGDKIWGRIWSDVTSSTGINHGERIVLMKEFISDWLISKPDGTEEGNRIGREIERSGKCIEEKMRGPQYNDH